MLLDPVRAIVLTNKIIVVIPDGADSMISMLTNVLNSQQAEDIINSGHFNSPNNNHEHDINPSDVTFEIKAFEAILDTVIRMHRIEYNRIELSIQEALTKVKRRAIIPAQLQEKMRGSVKVPTIFGAVCVNIISYL